MHHHPSCGEILGIQVWGLPLETAAAGEARGPVLIIDHPSPFLGVTPVFNKPIQACF